MLETEGERKNKHKKQNIECKSKGLKRTEMRVCVYTCTQNINKDAHV